MPKVCLVVLIGLPGAGKTSLCNQLDEELCCSEVYKAHMIEYDRILEEIKNEDYQNCYKELRNHAFVSTTQTIESIISVNDDKRKHIIFIDDNMYYRSMRYEYYKLAKKYRISFFQIHIDIPLETAICRNKQRDQKCQVPESVIQDMANKFEIPGKEHWESNLFILSMDFKFDKISEIFLSKLEKCFNEPVSEQVDSKTEPLPESRLQSIDLLLRRIVHDKLAKDKSNASMYISKRREIYKAIKNGKIILDVKLDSSELHSFLENLF